MEASSVAIEGCIRFSAMIESGTSRVDLTTLDEAVAVAVIAVLLVQSSFGTRADTRDSRVGRTYKGVTVHCVIHDV
jgi:hypothetical protein